MRFGICCSGEHGTEGFSDLPFCFFGLFLLFRTYPPWRWIDREAHREIPYRPDDSPPHLQMHHFPAFLVQGEPGETECQAERVKNRQRKRWHWTFSNQ
ncbi:hypothetical protein VTH06DRAFT_3105 [Thermothelomyces fergusii]